MRHRIKKVKFGLRSEYTKSMLRNLATSLLEHGKIETTEKRAKALKQFFDNMVGTAKRTTSDVQSKRVTDRTVFTASAVKKFSALKEKLTAGGSCVRITKLRNRRGDNATVVLVEIVTA